MPKSREIRDFDQIAQAHLEEAGEGPEFILGGITFKCSPVISTAIFAEYMSDGTEGNHLFYYKFLEELVEQNQVDDLKEVLLSREKIIPLPTLEELIKWLGEEYAARPTKP